MDIHANIDIDLQKVSVFSPIEKTILMIPKRQCFCFYSKSIHCHSFIILEIGWRKEGNWNGWSTLCGLYTMLLQLCGILNICQTLVLSSVGSILSWVLVLRQRMPIYSDPTLNRETFSISSGKIWQQLSTWGIPISPLFSPAGRARALNRRNDPHSEFRTRGGIICAATIAPDKGLLEEAPDARNA